MKTNDQNPLQNISIQQNLQSFIVLFAFLLSSMTTIGQSFSIQGDTSICVDNSATYTAVPSGNYTYAWSAVGGNLIYSVGENAKIHWSNPGEGTVALIVYDSTGINLLDTVSQSVHINPLPFPVIVPGMNQECKKHYEEVVQDTLLTSTVDFVENDCNVVCEGATVEYEAAGGATSGGSFHWEVKGDYISAQDNGHYIEVEWDTVGYGVVYLEKTTASGCVGTTELCVQIVSSPTAHFTEDLDNDTTCTYNDIHFFDQSSIDAVSWEWHFGDGTISTEQNPVHEYTEVGPGDGVYEVTLTVENACGCTDTYQQAIYVEEGPDLDLYCMSSVCPCTQTSYTILDSTAEEQQQLMLMGGGSTSAAQGPEGPGGDDEEEGPCFEEWVIEGPAQGEVFNFDPDFKTFDVEWFCEAGPVDTITVYPPGTEACCGYKFYIPIVTDTVDIDGDDTVCIGDQETYAVPLWPGVQYNWSVDPANAGTIVAGQGTQEVAVDWNTPVKNGASLDLSYEHPFLGTCSQGAASLAIIGAPQYSIEGPDKVCGNSPVVDFTVVSDTGGIGEFDYLITDAKTGDYFASGNVEGPSFNLDFSGSGAFLIKFTNTSGEYCEKEFYHYIEVVEQPPTPNPNDVSGERKVCPGLPYGYSYVGSIPGDYMLNWEMTDGSPDSSYGTETTVSWDASSSGRKLMPRFVRREKPHCKSDSVVVNIVKQSVTPETISGPDTVCNNTFKTYKADGKGNDFAWAVVPGSRGSVVSGNGSDSATIQWNNATGLAKIEVTRKICDTSIIDTLDVYITNSPPVTIVSADTLCQYNSDSFSVSPQGIGYNWHFGPYGTSTSANPVISYIDSGSYSVNVEVTFAGCGVSTAQKTVYVREAPIAYVSTPDTPAVCTGPTLHATAQNATGYQWYEASAPLTALGSGSTYDPTVEGDYFAVATISGLVCKAISNELTVLKCDTGGVVDSACTPSDDIAVSGTDLGCGKLKVSSTLPNGRVTKITFYDVNGPEIFFDDTATYTFNEAGYQVIEVQGIVENIDQTDSCNINKVLGFEVEMVPDFNYTFSCGPDSFYTLDFLNTSTYVPNKPITSVDWSTPGGTFSMNYNATEDFVAGATDTVTLEINNGGVVTCSTTKVINVPAKPEAYFTASGPNCEDQAVSFIDHSSGTVESYLWEYSSGGATATIEGNTVKTYEDPSSPFYTISLSITDEHGCADQHDTSVVVEENQLAGDAITPAGPFLNCPGNCEELTFTNNNALPGLKYLWSTLESTQSIDACNTGKYKVTVTDTTTSCIARRGPVHVGFHPLPQPTVLGDTIMCYETTHTLIGWSGPPYNYTWYDESWSNWGSAGELDFFSGAQAGPRHLYLRIHDPASSCADTGRFDFYVNPDIEAEITSPDPTPYCEGQAVEFSYTVADPPPASVLWSTGKSSGGITASIPGPYRVTAFDEDGCSDTAEEYIDPLPDWSNFMCGCYGFCLEEGEASLPGIPGYFPDYHWLMNGNIVASGTGYIDALAPLPWGSNEYQLVLHSPGGCIDTSCVAEITVELCEIEEPCELYDCTEDCHTNVQDEQIEGCVDTTAQGDPILSISAELWMPMANGTVVYVEDENGQPVTVTGTPFIPQAQWTPVSFNIVPDVFGAAEPFCITLYIKPQGMDSLCTVEICLEIPREGEFDCDGGQDKRHIGQPMSFGPGEAKERGSHSTSRSETSLRVYPNPAEDELTIEYNTKMEAGGAIAVYSPAGQKMYEVKNPEPAGQLEINTSRWPAGVYLVHLGGGDGFRLVKRVAVK